VIERRWTGPSKASDSSVSEEKCTAGRLDIKKA
jgi:hypothetical protein